MNKKPRRVSTHAPKCPQRSQPIVPHQRPRTHHRPQRRRTVRTSVARFAPNALPSIAVPPTIIRALRCSNRLLAISISSNAPSVRRPVRLCSISVRLSTVRIRRDVPQRIDGTVCKVRWYTKMIIIKFKMCLCVCTCVENRFTIMPTGQIRAHRKWKTTRRKAFTVCAYIVVEYEMYRVHTSIIVCSHYRTQECVSNKPIICVQSIFDMCLLECIPFSTVNTTGNI